MDDEATAFALELLMPSEWLLADLAKLGGVDIEDEYALKKLAARYRVSVPVMILRIGMLRGETSEQEA